MRRRRSGSSRTYTIAYLLSRQPKSLQKHELYDTMLRQFSASSVLKRVRFNRRCYSLLHNATIAPHNLSHFYRTYRLPQDPFFPLFFAVKRWYLEQRERRKEERERYALAALRSLPTPTLETVRYLGHLECYYHARSDSPLWQRHLFPGSKKRADEYTRLDRAAWAELFRRHLSLLCARYRGISERTSRQVIAYFLLELAPQSTPPTLPDRRQVTVSYRRLSLVHHPDRGGDPALFIEIKRARDTLLGER